MSLTTWVSVAKGQETGGKGLALGFVLGERVCEREDLETQAAQCM